MDQVMQTLALVEIAMSSAIVLIWFMQKVFQAELPFVARIALIILLANLFFWPLGFLMELPIAAYIRGFIGDLSIVSILLLWSAMLPTHKPNPIVFKLALALIAMGFYPAALGMGMLDPYVWGYGSVIFLGVVLLFALVCGLANWYKGLWLITLAIVAWSFHWHESTNLWDYLLDPFLAIWAIGSCISAIYNKRRERARSGYLFRAG